MKGEDAPDRRDALPRSAAGDRNPWLIAVIVSIATFMLVLDSSIANVALRYIAGSMAAGLDESTWVITTYLVANAVIIPISGWLADVVGRKRFYMICVAIFTIASFFCGLAPNLATLIVFRIIQGLGGGGMAPSEQAILADTFPPEKRAQAFALYGVAVIVAPTVGPTLGGWITDNYSWHWIFLINVPIGAVSLALVNWLVEPPVLQQERQERLRGGLKIDWVGFVLIALALGCLEVVLDRGEIDDWFQSNFILTFAIISAVFVCRFPSLGAHAAGPDRARRPALPTTIRNRVPDHARCGRSSVRFDPAAATAVTDHVPVHGPNLRPGLDAGRLCDATDDADRRAGRQPDPAEIHHGDRHRGPRHRHVVRR
jgi:DHA2 family multidrug resistance protein